MKNRYVIDTNALITYFHDACFQYSNLNCNTAALSPTVVSAISRALASYETDVLISIPSIAFIEIYEKWLTSNEFAHRFYYTVFVPIKQSPNIEVRSVDKEVLLNLKHVSGVLENHDLNDKLVVASAITLCSPLITSDRAIQRFASQNSDRLPCVIY